MKEETRNILKVAGIYVTTIIGAGFASGQEIIQFFSGYYKGGFYGILLAGLLFSLIGWLVLDRVYTDRIRNYDEFVFPTVGWFMGWVMEIMVTVFMFCVFCIMMAGLGNVVMEHFDLSFSLSVGLMALLSMGFMLGGIRGVMALSSFVAPILVVGIAAVGLYIITNKDAVVFNLLGLTSDLTDNWFFSSLLYVSYNSIMSIVVMCSLLPYLKSRRIGRTGGMMGGMVLCMIALILNAAIFFFYPQVSASELPILSIVQRYSSAIGILYSCVLWLAMFTSAVTAGYCFVNRIGTRLKLDYRLLTILACAFVIPLSGIGFSKLISLLYPIFGYLGLFMIFAVLLQGIGVGGGKKVKR